ncbi:kininogen-1 [Neoarius graeffei]|uniref:kininogen-1 n=1 Tax=Neoarius graeffei TaxID=443677 RepID=UPI00298D0F13|nr:kininogen-1 [Neoarius graeffei]
MQGHTIWVSLALTWLFCSASHADEETRLQCDDPNVQDIVASVLLAHNKELTEGNHLALYQILEAAKAKNESGEVLSLHFTARESDCAAGGEKPWQECNYLQDSSKLLRHCRAKVLLKETNEIFEHHCSVEPPIIAEPRPPCLGCPENIDLDSEDIKEPLSYSISKANLLNKHTHHFILNSVAWATRQVVAGFRYRIQFDLQKSNCTKEDFKDITEECHPDPLEQTFINCNSTVDVAPWRHELPDPSVNCEHGPLQTGFVIRRRPPGWSPLRNIHNFQVKPKKEESSEESQEKKPLSVVPTKSPNPSTDPVPSQPEAVVLTPNNTSFNCPSKPWKVFVLKIAPPPPPAPRPDSNDPVQHGFTDSSLT